MLGVCTLGVTGFRGCTTSWIVILFLPFFPEEATRAVMRPDDKKSLQAM